MKSIKNKILVTVVLMIFISLSLLGGISIYLNYRSTYLSLNDTMQEMAILASQRVAHELKEYQNVAYECGSIARLSSETVSVEDKKAIIDQRANTYDFQRGNIIGMDGISIFDGNDYSDRSYFQTAIKGETSISDPLVSKITGELTVIIAAPLWEGGIPNTTVVGVVYFVPKETFLNDIVSSVKVSKNGSAQILNNIGTIVAHPDIEQVRNQVNANTLSQTDSSYKDIAALEQKMIQGQSGTGFYNLNGEKRFLAFAPVENTNGWSLGVNAPSSDFLGDTINGIIITIVLLVAAIIISCLLAMNLASSIAKPVRQCAERLSLMAKGDLTSPVPKSSAKDETGALLRDLNLMIGEINDIIKDISFHMKEIGEGNLTNTVTREYKGDFAALEESVKKINLALNNTLWQINQSADQVASGSEQVSSGAQALSQGTTEQASAVEELAATINEIAVHVKNNADHAVEATNRVHLVGEQMRQSNEQMQNMISAMDEINNSSQQISKIIKTIEDIAFQTNILALNAAVEAARAGAAGKGFAVVADEVRNLASKSAEASKNTTELIASSINSVNKGAKIANETAEFLMVAVEGSESVTQSIEMITKASENQAQSVSQITIGIDQISSVVQTNSATAEESAAASEELSSQAQTMKDLVGKFRLKEMSEQEFYNQN